ncbi:hypothetical protein ABZ461_08375 [Actinacidiphila glaucinigra]|uniref:hypothetical protein n=1 Tax=Actinacidiphila glaucinigra TaxID=235986 RepID=UPI0033D705C1
MGTACALVGLLDLAAGVFPGFRHSRMDGLAGVFPGTVTSVAAAAGVVTGILMLMLAHGLKRGKRRAWRAAVLLLPVGAVAQVLHRHSLGGAVLSTVLLAPLIRYRAQFSALGDPRTRLRAVAAFAGLSVLSLVVGLFIVSAHPAAGTGGPTWAQRFAEVLYGLFGFDGPVAYATDQTADVVAYSLGGLGFLTAVTTAYLALRPASPVAELTTGDEERLGGTSQRKLGEPRGPPSGRPELL